MKKVKLRFILENTSNHAAKLNGVLDDEIEINGLRVRLAISYDF